MIYLQKVKLLSKPLKQLTARSRCMFGEIKHSSEFLCSGLAIKGLNSVVIISFMGE